MKQLANGEEEVIELKGGLTISRPAFKLMLGLEDRGVAIWADGDVLIARPRRLLTDADRAAIRLHRADLIALAEYVEREGELPMKQAARPKILVQHISTAKQSGTRWVAMMSRTDKSGASFEVGGVYARRPGSTREGFETARRLGPAEPVAACPQCDLRFAAVVDVGVAAELRDRHLQVHVATMDASAPMEAVR